MRRLQRIFLQWFQFAWRTTFRRPIKSFFTSIDRPPARFGFMLGCSRHRLFAGALSVADGAPAAHWDFPSGEVSRHICPSCRAVAARFVRTLAFFLLAIVGSGFAVLLTQLVPDLVILVVPWHFLRPASVKPVDVDLPVLFVTVREVISEPLPSSFLAR
jgi:hypothetical protein